MNNERIDFEPSTPFLTVLRSAQCGDASSIQTLMREWRPVLRRRAHAKCGKGIAARADSSDLVQNTLMRAFQQIHQFAGQSMPEWRCWLNTILDREASRIRRRHLAQRRSVEQESHSASREGIDRRDPASLCSADERKKQLYSAVQQLPPKMQAVVVHRVFDQLPFEAIARKLDVTPVAARVMWTRAMRRLKANLDRASERPVR